jgi:hypothetical protein
MIKSRYIYDVPLLEWQQGKAFMLSEVAHLHPMHYVRVLLQKAIRDFEAGKFSYDGATFVKERSSSLFEAAAFIHDWRNAMGYVSYKVDREMLDIMIVLDYSLSLINWRYFLTRFTFLNIARHQLLCTYVGAVPENLYQLPNINAVNR